MAKIIVDIGINHHGNLDIARKLIGDASECGADIVKFQWYSVFGLFGDSLKPTYNKEMYEILKPFELDESKIEKLIRWCEIDGVEFGCSVFDEERFLKLEAMEVKTHKIASRVSKYDRMLAEKILSTNKICYASLGFGADPFDAKYTNCKYLYCVSKYPSYHEDIKLPKSFSDTIYYGFSSHATTPIPSIVAISRGAKIIEVHFTLDKSMAVAKGGYDHLCSLNKTELKQLVDFSRQSEKFIRYCE